MSVINQIKHIRLIKITAVCGILIPIIIFTSIFFAISVAPWFEWTNNALSNLGVKGLSAFFFNNGLIIGGFLIFIFSLCLISLLKNKIGAYLLFGSSISLMGIGVFPETIFLLHYFTSAAFFILITITMLIIGITMYFNNSYKTLGAIALFFSIIAMVSPFTLSYLNGIAIPEAMACFPAFIWCMLFGIKIGTGVPLN
jgi:hypothetical membrane protein